ncbi:MAG: GNAT family N-acetyltransferase [Chlamydiia bacterium]
MLRKAYRTTLLGLALCCMSGSLSAWEPAISFETGYSSTPAVTLEACTLQGSTFQVRPPIEDDAVRLWEFALTTNPDGAPTLAQMERRLARTLRRMAQGRTLQLYQMVDDRIMGIGSVDMGRDRANHVGRMTIKGWEEGRDALIEILIAEAEKNLPDLEILTIWIFADNQERAAHLAALGFMPIGTVPNGIKVGSDHFDALHLYRPVVR